MDNPIFTAALDEALDALRARLVADAGAKARGEPIHGGIRAEWRSYVRQLAQLRRRISFVDATTPRTPPRRVF